jgi:predicted Zn-dependent protease
MQRARDDSAGAHDAARAAPAPAGRDTARHVPPDLVAAFAAEPELIRAVLEGTGAADPRHAQIVNAAAGLARRLQPRHADVHYFSACAAAAHNAWDTAAVRLDAALRINPNYNDARLLAAKACRARGDATAAIQHLLRILSSGGDYPDVLLLLATLYDETGDPERARHARARALQLNPRLRAAVTATPGTTGGVGAP